MVRLFQSLKLVELLVNTSNQEVQMKKQLMESHFLHTAAMLLTMLPLPQKLEDQILKD